MWKMLHAIHVTLPDFQHRQLHQMGFTALLSVTPFWIDVALLQGLKRRWDSACNAFILPWGHITPTLEDVARITGLRVHVNPVTGTTLDDYRGLVWRLLGYDDRGPGALWYLRGSALTDLLGVKGVMKRRGESMDVYLARMKANLSGRFAQKEASRQGET